MATTTSVYLLKALLDFSAARGADTDAMLKSMDLSEDLFRDENFRVPVEAMTRAWNEISRRIDDRFLGLHFGEAFGIHGERHFLFALMKNCRTLKEALESLIRYHRLMTDIVQPRLSVRGADAVIEVESAVPGEMVGRHVSESVMSLLATVLHDIAGGDLVFTGVNFTHEGPGDTGEYERIFSLKPVFNSSGNNVMIRKDELDRAFPLAHREFHGLIRHYAEVLDKQAFDSGALTEDDVLLFLKKNILDGKEHSLGAVSRHLKLGARQVQNRLRNEGTSYQVLLDEARKDISLHLIREKDVLLIDIAFMLGYSDQSSFNRAFKKWTGGPPKKLKNSLKKL